MKTMFVLMLCFGPADTSWPCFEQPYMESNELVLHRWRLTCYLRGLFLGDEIDGALIQSYSCLKVDVPKEPAG